MQTPTQHPHRRPGPPVDIDADTLQRYLTRGHEGPALRQFHRRQRLADMAGGAVITLAFALLARMAVGR